MEKPKVSIVILSFNHLKDTIECLESVRKIEYPNFDIIVVDNGSADGSAEYIKKNFPEVTVLENKENLGYAAGNNVGIRHALTNKAEYILLLNNDTIVDQHILESFTGEAKNHPDGAIFSAKIYYYSKPDTLWYGVQKWADEDNMRFINKDINVVDDQQKYEQLLETDYAIGCAMFISAHIVNEVGFFDPLFFLHYEEIDWCYRAKKYGYKCFIVPGAKIWHKVSLSYNASEYRVYYNTRNELLWAERYLPKKRFFHLLHRRVKDVFLLNTKAFDSRLFIKRLYLALLSLMKRLSRERGDPVFRAKYLGLRDYLFRRFGKGPDEIVNSIQSGTHDR
jgi:GT2 family glycosyltransferase